MAKEVFTAPWYPWYVKDVLTSERVDLLSLAEEGAYRRALDKEWMIGSIPADPKDCAAVIGNGCTKKIAERILELFIDHPKLPGRKINEKLEKVRKEQEKKYRTRSTTGKKNIAKRWKQTGSGDSNAIATVYQPNSIQIQNKNKKKEPPTPLNGSTAGSLGDGVKTEIGVWMENVARTCGAKSVGTLPKRDKWAEVVTAAVREQRDLLAFLDVIKAEDPKYLTPERCLQKLQMADTVPKTARLPTVEEKEAEIKRVNAGMRKPPEQG